MDKTIPSNESNINNMTIEEFYNSGPIPFSELIYMTYKDMVIIGMVHKDSIESIKEKIKDMDHTVLINLN
jgi:hypothetical protein